MSFNLPNNVGVVRDANGEFHAEQIVHFNPADELDTLDDQLLEQTISMTREQAVNHVIQHFERAAIRESERVRADTLCSCIGMLLKAKNPRLAVYGIAYALGLDELQGISMGEMAINIHVTKAAISKCAIKASKTLGLPRSRYMKSKAACESYRERQIQINRNK